MMDHDVPSIYKFIVIIDHCRKILSSEGKAQLSKLNVKSFTRYTNSYTAKHSHRPTHHGAGHGSHGAALGLQFGQLHPQRRSQLLAALSAASARGGSLVLSATNLQQFSLGSF